MTRYFASLSLTALLLLAIPITSLNMPVISPERSQTRLKNLNQDLTEQKRRDFRKGRELLNQEGVPFDPDMLLDPQWKATLDPIFNEMLRGQQRPRMQRDPRTKEERRRKDFEKAQSLLVNKRVPFDPEILLTDDWRHTLKSTFDQMPELQQVRRGTDRLKGVEIAHTLYLPAKVRLEGDTVIIARNLIFDGDEAVIRGPFSISVYPIDDAGLLGSSFEVALARALPKTGVRFMAASWSGNRANRGLPVMPIIRGGTIHINTSGLGLADWLESQRAMAGGSGRMIKAGFFQQGENRNSRARWKRGEGRHWWERGHRRDRRRQLQL